jgi:hypothetical protein
MAHKHSLVSADENHKKLFVGIKRWNRFMSVCTLLGCVSHLRTQYGDLYQTAADFGRNRKSLRHFSPGDAATNEISLESEIQYFYL